MIVYDNLTNKIYNILKIILFNLLIRPLYRYSPGFQWAPQSLLWSSQEDLHPEIWVQCSPGRVQGSPDWVQGSPGWVQGSPGRVQGFPG